MTAAMDSAAIERFRVVVARWLGLHFDETRLASLAEVLVRRSESSRMGVDAYLGRLERLERRGPTPADIQALAQEVTVGETYFFRNIDQFHAFATVALPERLVVRSAARTLRILSVGCASGEEAYSLAMVVRERLADPSWEVSIVGVDVNPAMLEKARIGRYSTWSLRETPPDIQRRWFQSVGREHVLDRSIRESVRFEERNLANEDPDLWPPGVYDVVFCRNVLMYFTPETACAVVTRMSHALAPSGYLFLGHAETLRGLSQDFHLCHTHDTFYYRRRDGTRATSAPPPAPRDGCAGSVGAQPRRLPMAVAESGWTATWIDAVERSSARILALSEGTALSPQPTAAPARAPASGQTQHLGRAIELLEREKFGEALEFLAGLPRQATPDHEALLLRAALLTHSGQLAAAESACRELQSLDEMSAGAHYLFALCREAAGDRDAATEHHRVAAYLDPDFAMPHLHLGRLARRAGDARDAQRELRRALVLLAREDAARILLFGGGFSREALTYLCSAELRGAGGDP
jgi:chemotaxis protein methyltransferase CheR